MHGRSGLRCTEHTVLRAVRSGSMKEAHLLVRAMETGDWADKTDTAVPEVSLFDDVSVARPSEFRRM
jgi:hypothetical protein